MLLTEYDAVRHIKSEKEVSYQEGLAEGLAEGRAEERKQNINVSIRRFLKQNISTTEICNFLCEDYNLTPEQALAYVENYTAE